MYSLLYIPGVIILLLPILKALHDARCEKVARKQRIAEKEAREAARRNALREAAQREAEKAAAEAAKPKRRPGRPRKNPVPSQRQENISCDVAPVEEPEQEQEQKPSAITYHGNNVFVGHVVSFTGTLPGMTRREAIAAVEKNGGKAFDTMPAATTILVIGAKPGTRKLDKADEWQSCKKISADEFFAMLRRPLTLEPDEFAALLLSRLSGEGAA